MRTFSFSSSMIEREPVDFKIRYNASQGTLCWSLRLVSMANESQELWFGCQRSSQVCVCVCACVCVHFFLNIRLKSTFLHNFRTSESKLISFFEVESLSSFSMLPLCFHSHYLSPYLLLLLFFFLQILFVDLAALGFSCGTWDLRCIM